MATSFCAIELAELAGVIGGAARVTVNGVEYGPGTYINGEKVDSNESGNSTTINQGSNSITVIFR